MKRIASLLLLAALAGVILLPVSFAVNNSSGNELVTADGNNGPIPPWPPNGAFNLPSANLPA